MCAQFSCPYLSITQRRTFPLLPVPATFSARETMADSPHAPDEVLHTLVQQQPFSADDKIETDGTPSFLEQILSIAYYEFACNMFDKSTFFQTKEDRLRGASRRRLLRN